MAAPFQVTQSNDGIKLTLRGSLDINTAQELSTEIDKLALPKPAKVQVDMAGLDLIDSSGVAALVKLYKTVRGHGGTVKFTGARDQPMAIFKLLRMDKVFDL